jgi:hypothetical protein
MRRCALSEIREVIERAESEQRTPGERVASALELIAIQLAAMYEVMRRQERATVKMAELLAFEYEYEEDV